MSDNTKSSSDGCFIWFVLLLIVMHSCGGDDNSKLTNEVKTLKEKVAKLEELNQNK